jgi:SOUL heme-binding protein
MDRRLLLVAAVVAAAGALFATRPALATETPVYEVLQRWPDVELRRYGATIVAETRVEGLREDAGQEGFRRLAGYIFGGNRTRASIAMTAPVGQTAANARIAMTAPVGQVREEGAWLVTFTMPASWSMETLPVPDDPRVTLREVPGALVLARRYSGSWSEARYVAEAGALDAACVREGLRVVGTPVWSRYDPPWTPSLLRRNEILLPVAAP